MSMELAGVRTEIERRLKEKEDEFENTKRNHQRAVESMQASLEGEIRAKNEVFKQKKKLELDVHELEINFESSNKINADLQKVIKKLQQSIADLSAAVEEEQRARHDAMDSAAQAERRANVLSIELEEFHQNLELSEKTRKSLEIELHKIEGTFRSSNLLIETIK
jgi:chromosome segregation ATPase